MNNDFPDFKLCQELSVLMRELHNSKYVYVGDEKTKTVMERADFFGHLNSNLDSEICAPIPAPIAWELIQILPKAQIYIDGQEISIVIPGKQIIEKAIGHEKWTNSLARACLRSVKY